MKLICSMFAASYFSALGILFLIAAPQKPTAMTVTAMMPNSTFFIGLFLLAFLP